MPHQTKDPEIKFHPPEVLSEDGDGAVENASQSDWDKALTYHEIKRKIHDEIKRERIRAAVIHAIIKKAMATMGAAAKPFQLRTANWEQFPQAELDLEESLEQDPILNQLIVENKEPRRSEVVVCIDTSLSMTGRKLALTAVALAVIALQLESEDLSVIAFETEANIIKPLGKKMGLFQILERFMEVPARGLTNIEAGLLMAAKEAEKGSSARAAVILMTDGRYTAGKNPDYIVPRLPKLHLVQTGNPWSSPRFCRSLARAGGGKFLRVAKLEHLPKAMYSLVYEIIR